jgi:hypothetical protein
MMTRNLHGILGTLHLVMQRKYMSISRLTILGDTFLPNTLGQEDMYPNNVTRFIFEVEC